MEVVEGWQRRSVGSLFEVQLGKMLNKAAKEKAPQYPYLFFYHWLFSAEARQRIRLAAQGSVRETVSFDDLGSIPLPVPSLDRQRAVARFLNASQREIELLRRLTQKYQRQKRGLMQKLLTGEWQVRAESEPCEAIGRNVGRITLR